MTGRYADYLRNHPSWFPGIVEYAAIGLGAGLVVAVLLVLLGFRLTRNR